MRDARTGAVTDRVKPPAGESFMRVTSTGQGAFFLTTSGAPTSGARGDSPLVWRLQVDAGGRAEQLAPVPGDLLPPGCRNIAASPGGTMLAYTVPDMTPRPSTAEVGLLDLATGERRIASLPAGSIGELSLANDGQTVAFQWQPRSGGEVDVYVAAAEHSDVSERVVRGFSDGWRRRPRSGRRWASVPGDLLSAVRVVGSLPSACRRGTAFSGVVSCGELGDGD